MRSSLPRTVRGISSSSSMSAPMPAPHHSSDIAWNEPGDPVLVVALGVGKLFDHVAPTAGGTRKVTDITVLPGRPCQIDVQHVVAGDLIGEHRTTLGVQAAQNLHIRCRLFLRRCRGTRTHGADTYSAALATGKIPSKVGYPILRGSNL